MYKAIARNERDKQSDFWAILMLMGICLVFLTLGTAVFHSQRFPLTENATNHIGNLFSFKSEFLSFSDFLWSVILACRTDIICVLLVAVSRVTKIQHFFIIAIFAYRNFLFGFCGAYMINRVYAKKLLLDGIVSWSLFFVYHVFYLAILICFASETMRLESPLRPGKKARYIMTLCGEIALVILLNVVYYFLISKI